MELSPRVPRNTARDFDGSTLCPLLWTQRASIGTGVCVVCGEVAAVAHTPKARWERR